MRIYPAVKSDYKDWNDFLESRNGSIYHLWQWGEITEKTLNYKRLFLISKNEKKKIKGILPLYFKKNISGNKLIALPCTCFVGILANDPNAKRDLMKFANELAIKKKAQIEFNSIERVGNLPKGLYQSKSNLADYFLKTNNNYQEFINSISSSGKRKSIRRLEKTGIKVVEADKDDIGSFYTMHSQMIRNMGVLTFPRELFELTYNVLNKESFFIKSVYKDKTKAYMWSFIYGRKLYVWKNAYKRGSSKESVYLDALLNENIKYACSRKDIKEIDFSCAWTNSGLAEYKMSWGFNPRDVYVTKNRLYKNKSLIEHLRRFTVR
jgi:hypothetical protein